jgi:hypothetical protein
VVSDREAMANDLDADLHARDEGEVPFTLARLMGHDDICDLLGPLMNDAQEKDPDVHFRGRIESFESQLRRLRALLK